MIKKTLLATLFTGISVLMIWGQGLFPVTNNGDRASEAARVGFIDARGKLIIGNRYYYAQGFSEGRAAVLLTRNGKWGYIDSVGNMVIPPTYDDALPFIGGVAVVKRDDAYSIIDHFGKPIPVLAVQRLHSFSGGLAERMVAVRGSSTRAAPRSPA